MLFIRDSKIKYNNHNYQYVTRTTKPITLSAISSNQFALLEQIDQRKFTKGNKFAGVEVWWWSRHPSPQIKIARWTRMDGKLPKLKVAFWDYLAFAFLAHMAVVRTFLQLEML